MADPTACSITDCGKAAANRRGWCNAHYKRFLKHGDPTAGEPMRMSRIGTCSVDGCSNRIQGRGLCHPHHLRLLRHGDPLAGGTSPGEPEAFLKNVALPYKGDECLIWPFGHNGENYGKLLIDGVRVYAHRVVCEETNGPAPSDQHEAAHNCGNGNMGCVTPGHLRWDTRLGNAADTLIHGTRNRGEINGAAKLTKEDVQEIRRLRSLGVFQRDLAEKFSVSIHAIVNIDRGRTWAWLST